MRLFKRLFTLALFAVYGFATQNQPTTAPVTIDQLTAELVQMATTLASSYNNGAITNYNTAKANVLLQNSQCAAPCVPQPLPAPPMLEIVNATAIAAMEADFAAHPGNEEPWQTMYVLVPYVDPNPAAVTPATPVIVLDLAHPVAPGYFRASSGDDHSLPAGTKITQAGHTYSLTPSLLGNLWVQIN